MEFRLTYEGPLHGSGNKNKRVKHKHEIRKKLHRQLKEFWRIHPYLKNAKLTDRRTNVVQPSKSLIDHLKLKYKKFGYNFVPLITDTLRLRCNIDILYLRRSMPGQIMQKGDLDNRLKTIFDSLQIPPDKKQLGGYDTPEDDEKPFFCLLADDELISSISVKTDILLEPTGTGKNWNNNDARLVLHVSLRPFDFGWDNISFG